MKKIKYIAIALLLTVIIVGCSRQGNDEEIEYSVECEKFYITETDFFSWCVVPPVVSENSENMQVLENHTESLVRWGADFSLEYFDKVKWIPVELKDQPWDHAAWFLLAGETMELPIMLYSFVKIHNNSKKGKYRIGREYRVYRTPHTLPREFSIIKVYAEFVIK